MKPKKTIWKKEVLITEDGACHRFGSFLWSRRLSIFNENFEGFDGANNGDVRWLWSGKRLVDADNSGQRIRDGHARCDGAALAWQPPALATCSCDKGAERRDAATTG